MADLPINHHSWDNRDEDKYDIDYNDTKMLWSFAMENCRVSEAYKKARQEYAVALKFLKIYLARAYKTGAIEPKHSEDKAYLIAANQDPECAVHLNQLIDKENEYRGLEMVLKARESALSFNQSLIKNQIKNT